MIEPFPEFIARSDLFRPFVYPRILFLEASRPEPVDQDALPVFRRWLILNPFDLNHDNAPLFIAHRISQGLRISFLIFRDQLGLFEKPECFLAFFYGPCFENSLPALHVNIEGKQRKVIYSGVPGGQSFLQL
jgi:hypothetical protein